MPKLKYRYEKESEIPTDHRNLYVESAGAFLLDGEDLANIGDVEKLQKRLEHREVEFQTAKDKYEEGMNTEIETRKKLETEIADLKKNRGSGANPALHHEQKENAPNPFKTGNLTEQARLYTNNPQEYERLQKAAAQ